MRTLIAALPVFLLPCVGNANFFSGNDVYQYCRDNPVAARFFAGGVFDAFDAFDVLDENRSMMCATESVTLGQAEDVMCSYLEKHPEERHLTAASLAMYAFSTAWPCRN